MNQEDRKKTIDKIKHDLAILMDEAIFYGKNGADYGDEGEEGMNHAYERITENLSHLA